MFKTHAFCFLMILLSYKISFASDMYSIESSPAGKVIVEQPEDVTLNYKQRRTQNGFLFGISSESYYPLNYQSLFKDVYIESITTSSINLIGVELGYKYNVSMFSLAGLFNYSTGSGGGGGRDLTITKQGLSANAALDGILNEPWVVPYFQAGVHQFNVSETNSAQSDSGSTSISFNYKYGLLFQIDWIEKLIDKSAQSERILSSGLENTFIDVYYATYMASSGAQDAAVLGGDGEPNTESSGEMGFGIKLEF